jgi:hypothetical protein
MKRILVPLEPNTDPRTAGRVRGRAGSAVVLLRQPAA